MDSEIIKLRQQGYKFITAHQQYSDLYLDFRKRDDVKRVRLKFYNYFYKKDPEGDVSYILDSAIKCKRVNSVFDADLECDVTVLQRFFIDEVGGIFDELSVSDLKFLFYDIETKACLDVTAPEPILSIAYIDSFTNEKVFLSWDGKEGLDDYTMADGTHMRVFSTEDRMIKAFAIVMKTADVIVGFNSASFDDVYLIHRAYRLGVISAFETFSRPKLFKNEEKQTYRIFSDFAFLDARDKIMQIFSRASDIEKPSFFSLDEIAKTVLGKEKIHQGNIVTAWETDIESLARYNVHDVVLLKEMCEVLKVMDGFIDRQNFVKAPLHKVYVNSYVIDLITMRMFSGYAFPTKIQNTDEFKIKGATVLETKPGFYKNVAVLDFSAMYPNVILAYSISPDKDKILLPRVVKYLVDLREIYKKKGKAATTVQEKQILKANEMVVKDLINSLYGVFGYRNFRLFDPVVANEITGKARHVLSETLKFVENDCKENVLYGDTDSFFVELKKNTEDELVEKINVFLAAKVHAFFKVDSETLFECMVLSKAKKMYVGLVSKVKGRSSAKKEIYAKGFQMIRSDTPTFMKKALKVLFYDLFEALSQQRNIVFQSKEKLEIQLKAVKSVSELLIKKQISKNLEDYSVEPQHVRAMRFSNENLGMKFDRNFYSGGMLYIRNHSSKVAMLDFDKDYEIVNGCFEVNGKKLAIDYRKYVDMFFISKVRLLGIYDMFAQRKISDW